MLTKVLGPGDEGVYGFEKNACMVTPTKVEDQREWRLITCVDRATGFNTAVMVSCSKGVGQSGELIAGEQGKEVVMLGLSCSPK